VSARTVRVDLNHGGDWEIELSDQDSIVTCGTFEDAKRVAYLCATHRQPCELIVCDAYHRVLHHELIDTHDPDDPARDTPQNVLLTDPQRKCG
jgi:hypothetical protein